MKKKFLKVFSVFLCFINLFSIIQVWGTKYKFSGDRVTKSEVHITPVKNDASFPSFYVNKSNTEGLKFYNKHYSKIPDIDLNDTILEEFYKAISGEKVNRSIIDIYGEELGTNFHYQLELNIMNILNSEEQGKLSELQSALNKKIAERVGFIKCKLNSESGNYVYIIPEYGNKKKFKFKNTSNLQIQNETIYLCKEELVTIKKLIGDSSSNEIDISDVLFENLNNLSNEEINNAINKFCDKIVKITDSMKKDYKVKDGNGANKKIKNKQDAIKNKKTTQHYTYMLPLLANKFEKECKKEGNNFDFYTPFGKVNVQRPKNGDCWVSCGVEKGKYENLLIYLDDIKNKCTKLELIKIYDYLSMTYDEILLENGEIDIGEFNKKVKEQFGNIAEIEPTDKRQASFAAFCGVLMVAEPWRFKDGGGLSRGTIRTVYKILNKLVTFKVINCGDQFVIERLQYNDKYKIKDSYGFVFGESGPGGEALAVFAHKKVCSKSYMDNHPKEKSEFDESKQWRLNGEKRSIYTSGKGQQLRQLDKYINSFFESKKSIEDNGERMKALNSDISDDEGVVDG